MQADEFEKKIQNKMEGFELVPGGEVWDKVSLRIKKNKKKRRALFYWLSAGFVLLALTSGLWFINKNNREIVISQAHSNVLKRESYKKRQDEPVASENFKELKKVLTTKNIKSIEKGRSQILQLKIRKNDQTKPDEIKITNSKPATKELYVNNKKDNNNDIIYKKNNLNSKPLLPHRFYNPKAVAKVESNDSIDVGTKFRKDSLRGSITKALNKQRAGSKKWNIGFTIFSGISDNLAGLSMDKSLGISYDSYPGTSGNTNYSSNRVVSNNYTSSFSFGIGFFLKKLLAKKISLSAGLDFHMYKAISKVGKSVTSPGGIYDSVYQTSIAVDKYYISGSSVNYSNKYHYAELPINLEYQINKNQDNPFIISAGISPGYLVTTNALYANPSVNVYYVDKQKFHRFQLSAQTAFSVPITHSRGYLLSAGPVVQYGVINAATNTNQHLFFTGLKANLILK